MNKYFQRERLESPTVLETVRMIHGEKAAVFSKFGANKSKINANNTTRLNSVRAART